MREALGKKAKGLLTQVLLFPALFLDGILSSCIKHLHSVYDMFIPVACQNTVTEPNLFSES